MSELRAARWVKDDKDRIYVNRHENGTRTSVGYVDVKTGYTRSTDPDIPAQQIYDLAATFAVAHQIGLPAAKLAQTRTVTQHADDLAKNKAGTAAGTASRGSKVKRLLTGKPADSWEVGARGEKEVGRILDRARDLKVLHSVVVNQYGADIDHLVFSPYGVYTVNTKTHRGATVTVNDRGMFVNGTAVSHISKAQVEAERVSRTLSLTARQTIPVTPVVVIAQAATLRGGGRNGVIVVTADRVLDTLRGRSSVLTPAQVDWLYERARRPETWA